MSTPPPFPLSRSARLAVLASGRGSNLQSLLDSFPAGHPLAQVVLVVSDHADAQALSRAAARGVEAHHIPWTKRRNFEARLDGLLADRAIDLVCLAGFMRILSAEFVGGREGRILNIHPSLLPEFVGLQPQRQALQAGRAVSGCTVHFVDAGIDSGPIVLRRSVPILPGDDEESLSARILEQEHLAYPQAIELVLTGRVSP